MKLYYEYTDIGISKDVNCTHAYEFLNDDGTISTYVEYENVSIPNPVDIKIPIHEELEVGLEKVKEWRTKNYNKNYSKLVKYDDIWVVLQELSKEDFINENNNEVREISLTDLEINNMLRTISESELLELESRKHKL